MEHVWAYLLKLDSKHMSQQTQIECLQFVNEQLERDLSRKRRRKRELKRQLQDLRIQNDEFKQQDALLRGQLTKSRQDYDRLAQSSMAAVRERDQALTKAQEETQRRKRMRTSYRVLNQSLDGHGDPQIQEALLNLQKQLMDE